MASSIWKAQSPLSCQLCDNTNVIKWKCMDCVLLMCAHCKERIHPKFKLSERHTIISLNNIGKEECDISAQFGSLQVSQPVISSVISTYKSNYPGFGKIQYAGNNIIFCSYHFKDKGYKFFIIQLIKESVKVLKKLDLECMDFVLDSKDNIYYGQSRGSDLNVKSLGDKTNTFLSTSPMIILAVHINKDNKIILGLRERGSPFPVTEFSTRQIALFDVNKKLKWKFEYDQYGKRVLSYIWRIATDVDNNIYAIDHLNDFGDGRIVAINTLGSIKFVYAGRSSVNSSRTPCNPTDIVITKTNIIIVSDGESHLLHALNTKGELIGLQSVKYLGLRLPLSLCLNSEGFLLIGCDFYKENSTTKIHTAQIAL